MTHVPQCSGYPYSLGLLDCVLGGFAGFGHEAGKLALHSFSRLNGSSPSLATRFDSFDVAYTKVQDRHDRCD